MRPEPSSFPKFLLLACLCGLLVGCASFQTDFPEDPGAGVEDLFPAYEVEPIPAKTRILLLAGGNSLANFLQEIVDQRQHWISVGYRPGEIACYYVRPSTTKYLQDKVQFDRLVPRIDGFYRASPELLYQHLGELAAKPGKEIFLYSTSHGLGPSEQADDYTLVYDVDPASTKEAGHRFVRPLELRNALRKFPATTSKYVVLQGCHSGGFIDAADSKYRVRTLQTVPSVTVLTASRFDRTSFGCGAGEEFTYYGASFLNSLYERPKKVRSLNFASLAGSVNDRVAWMEESKKIPYSKRSLPQYFSNEPRN